MPRSFGNLAIASSSTPINSDVQRHPPHHPANKVIGCRQFQKPFRVLAAFWPGLNRHHPVDPRRRPSKFQILRHKIPPENLPDLVKICIFRCL